MTIGHVRVSGTPGSPRQRGDPWLSRFWPMFGAGSLVAVTFARHRMFQKVSPRTTASRGDAPLPQGGDPRTGQRVHTAGTSVSLARPYPIGWNREAGNLPAPPCCRKPPAVRQRRRGRHRSAARYGPDDVPRFQTMVPTRLLPGARTARESALMGYAAFRRLRPEKRSSAPPLRGNPRAASSRA